MGEDFQKLGCYAKKVVIDKVNDDTLKICVEDEHGDEHTLNVGVIIENLQNVDTFGDKQGHMIDVPTLNIDYSIKKTEKIKKQRESLGSVNLRADEETKKYETEIKKMEDDRADLYSAIVKLKSSIDELNQKGRELSGGQRRRVEIARCLVTKPNMILMDEPFAGIDPIAVDDIKKILNKLVTKDISILITDHNVGAALEICNRALILSEGKILAEGSTNELINNNKVKEVYLGEMYS